MSNHDLALREAADIARRHMSDHSPITLRRALTAISLLTEAALNNQRVDTQPAQKALPLPPRPRAAKISETMREVLDKMAEHGHLVRWPGGFWTYPNCPTTRKVDNHLVPDWYVGVQTLKALAKRDMVRLEKGAHTYAEYAYPIVEV